MKTAPAFLLVAALGLATGCSSGNTHRIERHYDQRTTTVETQNPDGSPLTAADPATPPPARRVVTEETFSPPEIVIE